MGFRTGSWARYVEGGIVSEGLDPGNICQAETVRSLLLEIHLKLGNSSLARAFGIIKHFTFWN